MLDARGVPTPECPNCGSWLLRVNVTFGEDYKIAQYLLDGECAMCGTLLTVPTEIDHPEYEELL